VTSPARLAILLSGAGTNMQAIVEACASDRIRAQVVLVVSDRADAPGLARAAALGVPACAIPPTQGESREQHDQRIREALEASGVDFVILAGYMRILSNAFVESFTGRMLNIHPSLLPRHKGLHTHRQALQAGELEHGATVHFVTAELDGGPAVLQARVAVLPGDDEQSLAERVQRSEHRIYPQAIEWLVQGRLRLREGRPELDTEPLTAPRIEDHL
jgi:phosphoribosylglycinamide formyltransferase-1